MKRTYNKIQETYLLTKAYLETLEAEEREIEHEYIINNGIVNQDGSVPKQVYCIDNDETFDKANAECSAAIENSRLWAEIIQARELLRATEEELLKYGLSVVPHPERDILTKAVSKNYTTRLKVLDLILKLDVATVCRIRRILT